MLSIIANKLRFCLRDKQICVAFFLPYIRKTPKIRGPTVLIDRCYLQPFAMNVEVKALQTRHDQSSSSNFVKNV